jgi:transcriptional regulator with XRE-family HTH domain
LDSNLAATLSQAFAMQKSTFTHEYTVLRKLLQEHRVLANVTQAELARRVDETQSYISKVERGERRLDLVQLQFFCKALGISLREFITAFEERTHRLGRTVVKKRPASRPSGKS